MEGRQESRLIIAERLVTSFTKQSRDMVLTLSGGKGGLLISWQRQRQPFDLGYDLKCLH